VKMPNIDKKTRNKILIGVGIVTVVGVGVIIVATRPRQLPYTGPMLSGVTPVAPPVMNTLFVGDNVSRLLSSGRMGARYRRRRLV